MFASQYLLGAGDCRKEKITDLYSLHRVIYSLFPQQENRRRDFLFVEKKGRGQYRRIHILSARPPQANTIGRIATKAIPENFTRHENYRFAIRINPVRRENRSGKLRPLTERGAIADWFSEKAQRYGFHVDESSLTVNEIGVVTYRNQESRVTLAFAEINGRLSVSERQKFINSFKNGIGRGKGFGFGLLQIVPLNQQIK